MDRNLFESWINDISLYIDDLKRIVPKEMGGVLDYSPESLELIEHWVLQKYHTIESIKKDTEKETLNCIACYVGESFRKNMGSHWNIDLEDKKYAYYGIPTIIKCGSLLPICPVTLVTASIDRDRENYMRSILERALNKR